MSRDYAAIMKSADSVQTSITENEVISLPPGYIVGFDVRLRPDYTVLIKAGAANVGGSLVQHSTDHQLEDADWVAPKINSTRHYYIYLAKDGAFKVDIVAPVWNNDLLYYEQPDMNWRAIGKIFLVSSQIVYAVKQVELKGSTVTVAPAGFTGEADYYCTGENDQILINAAVVYMVNYNNGGTVSVLSGYFYIGNSVVLDSNINLSLQKYARLIRNGSYIAISCVGTSLAHKENVAINGEGEVTRLDSSFVRLIHFEYCDDIVIDKIRLLSPQRAGIYVTNCSGKVSNTVIDGQLEVLTETTYGIEIDACTKLDVLNNTIFDLRSSGGLGGIVVSNDDDALILGNTIQNLSCAGGQTTGIELVITNRNTISNNRILTCKNTSTATAVYAISIDGSCNTNSVTSNYCYNNGSDTGIANTNSNNFYDAGTDTQVYSNSWQTPVSGEPEQGELHWLPQSTNTNVYTILDYITTTAAWVSVSLGSLVPVGSKSIIAGVRVNASAAAAGQYYHFVSFSNDYSATPGADTAHPQTGYLAYASGAGERILGMCQMEIPLTADRKFYYYGSQRSNATSCYVAVYLKGYLS